MLLLLFLTTFEFPEYREIIVSQYCETSKPRCEITTIKVPYYGDKNSYDGRAMPLGVSIF